SLLVPEIDPNSIERRLDACGARGGCDPRTGKGQLCLAAAPRHVDVEGEVTGPKCDTPGARIGCQNPLEVGEPTRRLDDRDQIDCLGCQVSLALQLYKEPIDRGECGRIFDLWQDDSIEPRTDDLDEIAVTKLGVGSVDPNIEERLARLRQRRSDG